MIKENAITLACLITAGLFAVTPCDVSAITKPSKAQITKFISSLSGAGSPDCPSAYTQFPNIPTVEYPGQSKLRSSKLIANVPASAIQQDQVVKTQPYLSLPLPDGGTLGGYTSPNQNVDLYQIHYASTNTAGESTLLSGLVALPVSSLDGGLIVYDHATQLSQISGAPSTPSGEACMIITALAGKNRILAMPDYLGFGINNDLHPYPLGPYNAPAGIDIITAARELAQQLRPGLSLGSQVFVTGYSEGGGNALWLGRELEKPGHEDKRPTLIAPMSGNYDMTGAMAHSLIVPQPLSPITLVSKPLLLTFTAQAGWEMTSVAPASLIQNKLAEFDQNNPLPIPYAGQSESKLYMLGLTTVSYTLGYPQKKQNPAVLMQPGLVNDITSTNLSNPVVALWAQSNNIDWTPKAPVYATGILQDEIVPFAGSNYPVPPSLGGGKPFFAQGNSQNLIAAMRGRGLAASQVAWCAIGAEKVATPSGKQTINHLTGVVPVSILAARAIESGTLSGLPMLPNP